MVPPRGVREGEDRVSEVLIRERELGNLCEKERAKENRVGISERTLARGSEKERERERERVRVRGMGNKRGEGKRVREERDIK
jgi:hypothetical protein